MSGASLAISILEYFRNKNILTIATTHYQELKRYALLNEKVQNASVEFDIENLKPTYKLLIGVPGKSNAFAISEKLGIKPEIIAYAKKIINKNDSDFEEILKKIYDDKINIESTKKQIEKNLNQVELLRKNLEKDDSKLQQQKQQIIDKAKLEARDILLNAKEEATKIINEMRKIENEYTNIDKLNSLRNNVNTLIKTTSINTLSENTASNPISIDLIKPNQKVYITNLKQNGIIISNASKTNEVHVQIGTIKTKVNIKYLELPRNIKNDLTKTEIKSNPRISKTKTINSELNVIGLTILEAIPIIDKFIDDCFLAKLQTARIVHGKGTGKLREAIHKHLKKDKRIKSYRCGTFGEGEMGVTIIELK